MAAERLSGELEKRGARALVVYLPDAPDGSKQGADDFIAGGGTVPEILALAQPFKRRDVGKVRLSKNEKLRAHVAALERTLQAMPVKTRGEITGQRAAHILAEESARTGKLVKDGVGVRMSMRTMAEGRGGSLRAASRATTYLEDIGYLRRDNRERKREQAGAFVLLTDSALGKQEGSNVVRRENLKPQGSRESFDSYGECDPGVYLARYSAQVPELRWSTTYKRREIDKFGRAKDVYEHLARLGKKRGAIVEHLLAAGGSATVVQLMEVFAGERTRAWDFVRRTLAPLTNPAVIVLEGDAVRLTPDWREALEQHRKLGGEEEQARLQRERHKRQREAFRTRMERPADPEPEPAPPIDDLRQPWPRHPEPCACRECSKRFGKVIGEHVEDCRCGPCAKARREKSKARTRAHLRLVETPSEPEPMHPLSCECEGCVIPAPRYARPWGGA